MDRRGSLNATPSPGQFRCLACKRTVTGTATGHCPSCGLVPPSMKHFGSALPSDVRSISPTTIVVITLLAGIAVGFIINW